MGVLKNTNTYWEFRGQCTACGHCVGACPSLTAAALTLGEIAGALLAVDRAAETAEDARRAIATNKALVQAVRGCFFCTSCKNTCFAHNDVCALVYAAREDFQALGLIPRDAWSSVQVDQEWDIFTAYRAIHGIGYADLTRHFEGEDAPAQTDCELAFFPGCSLAAYGPELTREIFATLEQLGGKTTLIDHCCGSPLKSAGFLERAQALTDGIAQEIAYSGAKQLVCVCPGCANALKKALERAQVNVRVISLPLFLTEHGFEPARELPTAELCLSKSCQDRDGKYLAETAAALGVDPHACTIYSGCCGAGGAVSAFQPERGAAQTDGKLAFAPDGSVVVSLCPTCTYTYAARLAQTGQAVQNKHYAELLFESQLDWDTVFGQLGSMWYGEYGAWLAQALA